MARTMLVHLNIEMADDSPLTLGQVEQYIQGALEVGLDPEQIGEPLSVTVADAEEV